MKPDVNPNLLYSSCDAGMSAGWPVCESQLLKTLERASVQVMCCNVLRIITRHAASSRNLFVPISAPLQCPDGALLQLPNVIVRVAMTP